MRTAFGIGLKSDILCYLLGQRGSVATSSDVSNAIGYTERNTRTAGDDLVEAGLAVRDDYSPQTTYGVPAPAWTQLLSTAVHVDADSLPDVARWRNWFEVFAFLAHVLVTAGRAKHGWSDYVIESRARDLVEEHYPRLIRAGVLTWNGQMARESSGLDSLRRIRDESVSALDLAL